MADRIHTGFKIQGDIKKKTFDKLVEYISEKERKELNILIDSEGGDIEVAFSIYDLLYSIKRQILRPTIHTIVIGKCWSAANIIFCTGDYRKAFTNSSFMLHNIITSFEEDNINVIYAAVNHTMMLQDKMYEIIGNNMSIDPKIKVKNDHEWYMDAHIAKGYKYVHEVIGR